ncbi:MAG: hypothetical protein M0R75_01515 [Dehalococcoidia bacterium]|nr:hypothetical protein [Dehalococcoidia bacterium]
MAIAGFIWTDDDGAHDIELVRPLMRVVPAIRRPTWSEEAIGGAVQTAQSPAPAAEISGEIRFVANVQAVLDMLSSRRGDTLTYYEERTGGQVTVPVILVDGEPGRAGGAGLYPDPDRYSHGEYAAAVRLRRVDGGTFAGLFS